MKHLLLSAATGALLCLAGTSSVQAQTQSCTSTSPTAINLNSSTTICGTNYIFTNPNPVNPTKTSVTRYLGIQYGQAGRWQSPKAVDLPANGSTMSSFGNVCPQNAPVPTGQTQSEDCLYLNIWTPANVKPSSNLPVMVFIHGGAFVAGEGSSPIYDGSSFASKNVILVTINYRLGALGFLASNRVLNSIKSLNFTQLAGNYGIQDQQLALNWVQNYISAFGGNPNKVTVFGESAGAMSVGLHALSIPSSSNYNPVKNNGYGTTSTPLFSAALMESNPVGSQYSDAFSMKSEGDSFIIKLCGLGCTLETMNNTPYTTILSTQKSFDPLTAGDVFTELSEFPLAWAPNIDGNLIIQEPLDGYAAGVTKVPMAFGVNQNEGTLFAALAYAQYPDLFSPPKDGIYPFGDFISDEFPTYSKSILSNPSYDYSNYQSYSGSGGVVLNNVGYAVAQFMTDYAFACGNVALANTMYKNKVPQIYGYQFTQPPALNVYASDPAMGNGALACSTSAPNNVCHGSELPYVFNTLGSVDSIASQSNLQLADNMNTAWVNFATNPSAAQNWTPYTPYSANTGGNVTLWNSSWTSSNNQTTVLDTASNCSNIWLNVDPYGPTSN